MSNLFGWYKAPSDAPPRLDTLIAAAAERSAALKASLAGLALQVTEGVPGAQGKYSETKQELARVVDDAAILEAAKIEHAQREEAKALEHRREQQRQKVAKVKVSLRASAKAAADFQQHMEAAAKALDALVKARAEARAGWPMPIVWSKTHLAQVRALAGCEMYRVGARLNHAGNNESGLPPPGVDQDMHRGKSNPASIPSLVDRLAEIDARLIAHLEGEIK